MFFLHRNCSYVTCKPAIRQATELNVTNTPILMTPVINAVNAKKAFLLFHFFKHWRKYIHYNKMINPDCFQ